MTQPIPSKIRALLQPDASSTQLIETLIAVPVPAPDTAEHLLRVHTTAFCNGELLWAKNFPVPEAAHKILIPCDDVAGTVISAPASSPFVAGSEVYARTNYARAGNAREYSIALTEELAFKPRKLTWAEAASVPLSALTAWQALFVHAGLTPPSSPTIEGSSLSASGKRILMTGAAGAVGLWAVQLAKIVGAEVVATSGRESFDFLRSLGASEVLDYKTTKLKEWAVTGKKVDIVFDCVGRETLRDAWWTLKPEGLLISIHQPPLSVKPQDLEIDVKNLFFIMEPNGMQLQKITDLIEEGDFQVKVDSVWSMSQFEEAREHLENGHPKGKVVFDLLK